jgi:hypothetical protein
MKSLILWGGIPQGVVGPEEGMYLNIIQTAGLGVIWNLITQMDLYPSPFVVAHSSNTDDQRSLYVQKLRTTNVIQQGYIGF